MKYLFLILLMGCGRPEAYTPWDSKINHQNSNSKNLQLLSEKPQSYPFTLGIIADPQGTPKDLFDVTTEINSQNVDFVVVLGDITDYGLKDEYLWAYKALSNLKVPFLAAPGNHDGLSKGKSIYQDLFGEYNYSFTYSNIKFVMWNNNCQEFQDLNWEFLQREFQDGADVLLSHQPTEEFTCGSQAADHWRALIRDYGHEIRLQLHGHRHMGAKFFEDVETRKVPTYVSRRVRFGFWSKIVFESETKFKFYECVYQKCNRFYMEQTND